MTRYVGLLRAVNVGGTGKLPMADLRAMCAEIGFADVQTYIASGNVVFDSAGNQSVVIFLDAPPDAPALADARHVQGERMQLGRREIYVHYVNGQGASRLRIPAADQGTARNMNTLRKLTKMLGA